jgi:hypothetical protein
MPEYTKILNGFARSWRWRMAAWPGVRCMERAP